VTGYDFKSKRRQIQQGVDFRKRLRKEAAHSVLLKNPKEKRIRSKKKNKNKGSIDQIVEQ